MITVEPSFATPSVGNWSVTVPPGRVDVGVLPHLRLEAGVPDRLLGLALLQPDDVRDLLLAVGDEHRHGAALLDLLAGAGLVRTTVPLGSSDSSSLNSGRSLALRIWLRASIFEKPTTNGTATIGLPVDTTMSTWCSGVDVLVAVRALLDDLVLADRLARPRS